MTRPSNLNEIVSRSISIPKVIDNYAEKLLSGFTDRQTNEHTSDDCFTRTTRVIGNRDGYIKEHKAMLRSVRPSVRLSVGLSVPFFDSLPFARWRHASVIVSHVFDRGQHGRL